MLNGRKDWQKEKPVNSPGQCSPSAYRVIQTLVSPVVKVLHRPLLTGTEKLPERGAFLLVANHSAGIAISEIFSFAATYLEAVGPDRPLAGFALPTSFRFAPFAALASHFGAIPSTYDAAKVTLSGEVPILVFPGGDYECLRPIHKANQVDFGGRLGFLRIAREAGVPIVPMGIRGSHFTAPVLLRSKLLTYLLIQPKLYGLKRWGITLLGVIVAALIIAFVPISLPARILLVWLWLGSPLVFLPWIPWTIRFSIGEPIQASSLFKGEDSEEELHAALSQVEQAVQSLVDSQ